MDYEKVLGEHKFPTYEELKTGLIRLIDEGKISREDAARLIPELRESEDERIIRAIIDALYSHTNSINLLSSRGYQMENIEAWLEKQKYDRMKPVYDNQDSFESALEKAWKDYNDSGARTVDGCEDNYVECAHAKGFREGYLFGIEKQKEQKPAVTHGETYHVDTLGTQQVIAGKMPQKPAEWSEEDERYVNGLIGLIEDMKVGISPKLRGVTADKCIAFLKSLRPSWKPSEEQMNCLCAAVDAAIRKHNESVGGYEPARVLKSLYEDLQKL